MDWFDKSNKQIKHILKLYEFDKNYIVVKNDVGETQNFVGESIVSLYLLNRGLNIPDTNNNWAIYPSRRNWRNTEYHLALSERNYKVFPFLRKYKTAIAILTNDNKFHIILHK